jgi:hypothetical protein
VKHDESERDLGQGRRLDDGGLKAMLLTNLKIATAVLLVVAVLGMGAGGLLCPTQAAKDPVEVVKPAPTLDLTKIDRTIRKEPAYRGQPRYALLVLGPKAEQRMWLVIDGETLYIDRNGNGDLTEKGEQVMGQHPASPDILEFRAGPFVEADGKTKHSDLIVYQYFAQQYGHLVNTVAVMDVHGVRGQTTNAEDDCAFAEAARDAPIIHINGPLTLMLHSVWVEYDNGNGKKLKEYSSSTGGLIDFRAESNGKEVPYLLKPGEKVLDLQVKLGTPGLGKGTFAALPTQKGFPADIHPVVEINVPSKTDPRKTVKREFSLKERC